MALANMPNWPALGQDATPQNFNNIVDPIIANVTTLDSQITEIEQDIGEMNTATANAAAAAAQAESDAQTAAAAAATADTHAGTAATAAATADTHAGSAQSSANAAAAAAAAAEADAQAALAAISGGVSGAIHAADSTYKILSDTGYSSIPGAVGWRLRSVQASSGGIGPLGTGNDVSVHQADTANEINNAYILPVITTSNASFVNFLSQFDFKEAPGLDVGDYVFPVPDNCPPVGFDGVTAIGNVRLHSRWQVTQIDLNGGGFGTHYHFGWPTSSDIITVSGASGVITNNPPFQLLPMIYADDVNDRPIYGAKYSGIYIIRLRHATETISISSFHYDSMYVLAVNIESSSVAVLSSQGPVVSDPGVTFSVISGKLHIHSNTVGHAVVGNRTMLMATR